MAPAGNPLKAPFPWFGGKSRAAELVWSRLGDVGNYVEPFAGSLAVLLARPHEPRIETVNDRDTYLANFWRAVQCDPEAVARHADWPVSEADLQARHRWLVEQTDFRERVLADAEFFDAKIAGWWVWGISQWIGAGWCSRPDWTGRGSGGRCPRGINTDRYNQRPVLGSSGNGIHASTNWAGHLDGKHKRPVLNHGARGVVNVGKRPHLSGHGSTGVHRDLPLEAIVNWMNDLCARLRRVRICCGDWARVVTPSCTWKLGGGQLTGVFLDPPYTFAMRDSRLYSIEQDIAGVVRAWAIENGSNRNLRIALCGLDGEHEMPAPWQKQYWRAPRGYSNKGPRREVIWFSPWCLTPQINLFAEDVA